LNIISRFKYLKKLGSNLIVIPIFVFIAALISGFTSHSSLSSNIGMENSGGEKSSISAFENLTENNDVDLFSILNVPPESDSIAITSKVKIRHSKFRPFKNAEETIVTSRDTISFGTSIMDSLKIDSLALDSTSRIKYFTYKRKDHLSSTVKPEKKFSFFAYPSDSRIRRIVKLDSSGQFVTINEKLGNIDYKVGLKVPLDDYIEMQMEAHERRTWNELTGKYELKTGEEDFSQLMKGITNIEIPLPSSSIFSIFGPPKISLRVNGSVDIHGAWRNETTEGVTASLLGNTRNEPDFKQQVQINVQGTIGDKLNLSADWNTERDFSYENQLKLKYTGYEDEIIQSIEAGNVSLQTSPLVGGSEALFGIKAEFKMGPFKLTALASQKKGETEEVSLTGGSKSQTFEFRAYDYSKNHYFLHEDYSDETLNIFEDFYGNNPSIVNDKYKIKDIEVWKSIVGLNDPNERKANAFIDLETPDNGTRLYGDDLRNNSLEAVAGESVIGTRFIKLEEGTHYEINKDAGFISFKTSIQSEEIIAAAFIMENGPGEENDKYYGEFLQDNGDMNKLLVLKLIKPANLQPSFKKAWRNQLKNIYPIGGKDVKKEDFVLDIYYQKEGSEPRNDYEGTNLLEAFRLDKLNESGAVGTDGVFDYLPGRTINTGTGEVIFPVLEPFGKNLPSGPTGFPDSLRYQAVYDTTYNIAKNDRTKDKFIIKGEYSASVTSSFNVGFNVVENSVKVFLAGNELKEGSDYTVDYLLGQVRIRKDEALVPGADLRITYEKNDLFQMASKTMLGLRGIYEFNDKTSLGFSYLNLNQQTLSDKVRIGEEPLNNVIMGTDFKSSFDLPFITKGLDYVMSTKEMSNFSLNAEYAYISPEPNTKKSTIEGDNGKSIAYIDDFEGSKRKIPIGDGYSGWTDISVPNNMFSIGNMSKLDQMNFKAKTYWFNLIPSDVTVQDIWGDSKKVAREDQQQTVLDLVVEPSVTGTYNQNSLDELASNPTLGWGGMMKRLSASASNLIDENIEFIEFWVNIQGAPDGTNLYVDLGQISEDVIPNGTLNTEDLNFNDQIDKPPDVAVDEDLGLDGLDDIQEAVFYLNPGPDPAKDNFVYQAQSGDYSKINGTQGSAASVERLFPDSEDLNRNSNLDRLDSYFRYKVPLDTVSSPFLIGGGFGNSVRGGWFLFRIPLKDYTDKIGDPSLSIVESIRIWTNGLSSPLHIRLFDINLVGNQWRKVLTPGKVTEEDEVLTISTINVEDDPEYYSPAGLKLEKDRTKTDQDVFKNEQSLRLIIKDLEDGDTREIVKYLFRPLDLFNYKEMKMFYWGDTVATPKSLAQLDTLNGLEYKSELFFRFGTDSLNYYEYRAPIGERWNEIDIKFEKLTAIKQKREELPIDQRSIISERVSDDWLPGHYYSLRGNPTLTRVTFFSIGIYNPPGETSTDPYSGAEIPGVDPISGDLWINELRVLDADDSPGWAYSSNATLKLADFIKVDVNSSKRNPFFHRISERFGNRIDAQDWGVTASLNVLKLIPVNLSGSNFNISYTRKESTSKPLFLPGTDIAISEVVNSATRGLGDIPADSLSKIENDIRSTTETLMLSETFTVSNLKIRIPSNSWYVRDIINGFTFSFSLNKQSSRNPTTQTSNTWRWDASANYALNLGPTLYVQPPKWPLLDYLFEYFPDYKNFKIFYLPQTFSLGVNTNRKRSFVQTRTEGVDPKIQRDFLASRDASFNWRITEGGLLNTTLNYRVTVKSSLAHLLVENFSVVTDTNLVDAGDMIESSESEIWNRIFGGGINYIFGNDVDYTQVVDFKVTPRLPKWFDLDRSVQIGGGYTVTYNWMNNLSQPVLGRSAKYTSRLSANITIKLKQLFDPLLGDSKEEKDSKSSGKGFGSGPAPTKPRAGRVTSIDQEGNNDTTTPFNLETSLADSSVALTDSLVVETEPIYETALYYLRHGIKWLLFDYDQINFTFSRDESRGISGIHSMNTGFNNFWTFGSDEDRGPSALFMLGQDYGAPSASASDTTGLINGPLRAPNGNLSDNYFRKFNFDLKTSRDLWPGAKVNLSWHFDKGENKSFRLKTDESGFIISNEISGTKTFNRTFMSFPAFIPIGTSIDEVRVLYSDTTNTISTSFVEGFEAISFVNKIPLIGNILEQFPRPNWSFTWNGIEKIGFLSFADKISLTHAYTSNYSEGIKVKTDGTEEIQSQKIDYGFNPLIGINFGINKLFDGSFTSSVKYSTKATYSLGASTNNITEDNSADISISFSYAKKGFELPMFGINFKNDLEFSFTYTQGDSETAIYNLDEVDDSKWKTTQNGQTRVQLEPRLKFQMSQTVTASVFYRRTTFDPKGAGRKPPTTTNEMGLDINIQIR